MNADLDKKVRQILGVRDRLEANAQGISSRGIKKQLVSKDSGLSSKSFIQYWEKQNVLLEKNQSYGTLKTYKSILKELKEGFLGNADLSFEDINIDLLKEYRGYLKRTGYSKNTIHNHLKTFRSILYKAIKEPGKNYFNQDKNPFFAFKLEADKTQRKERLNAEEIKKLEGLKLEKGTRVNDARNMFLFSFYCAGIRRNQILLRAYENICSIYLITSFGLESL